MNGRGPRDPAAPAAHAPSAAYVALAAVPLVVAAAFLALGAGYVLDDWFFRANARFDGTWSVAGPHAGQRPGAVPLWALVFGPWAGHPVPSVLLAAAANSLFAVCLAVLLRRVLPERLALAVAFAWAILPSHTSLEVWLSCINIAWSQAAAALALVVGWRDGRRWWHLGAAAVLLGFAVLAYEANVVVVALAVVALPWLRRGRPDWPLVAVAGLSTSTALAWVLTHWFEGKDVAAGLAPIHDVLVANTGWALLPPGGAAQLLAAAALVPIAVAVARHALPSFRTGARTGERLVLAGVGVMVAGTLPFALYVYEPLGAGDRMNGLSAVGGALFLVGAAVMAAGGSRTLATAAAVVAIVAATATRADRLWLWHLAGRDARAVLATVVERFPSPPRVPVVLGPRPLGRNKIVAFRDTSSVLSAVRVAYDDQRAQARLTQTAGQFRSVPEALRLDMRPVSRLDDR